MARESSSQNKKQTKNDIDNWLLREAKAEMARNEVSLYSGCSTHGSVCKYEALFLPDPLWRVSHWPYCNEWNSIAHFVRQKFLNYTPTSIDLLCCSRDCRYFILVPPRSAVRSEIRRNFATRTESCRSPSKGLVEFHQYTIHQFYPISFIKINLGM